MNPYNYDTKPVFILEPLKKTKEYNLSHVVIVKKSSAGEETSKTTLGEYYRPASGTEFPFVILAHGIGDRGDRLCRTIAKYLVKRGFACFVAIQLFHPRRISENLRPRFPNIEPEEWFDLYRDCVIEMRQMVDWASENQEIVKSNIFVLGISLGGIISAIAMGVEDRIKAGIFSVAGGNFESLEWQKKAGKNLSNVESSEIEQKFRRYVAEVTEKGFENVIPGKKSYLYDPVTFGYRLKERPLLMIEAMWDELFPRKSILDLWEACGEPAIRWFPGTHGTVWLLYPMISRQIVKFLKSVSL